MTQKLAINHKFSTIVMLLMLLGVPLLTTPWFVDASDLDSRMPEPTEEEIQSGRMSPPKACSLIAYTAKMVMTARQSGVPMSKMTEKLGESFSDMPDLQNIMERLIVEAYEMPRFEAPDEQEKAIEDFMTRHYLICFKALRRQGSAP